MIEDPDRVDNNLNYAIIMLKFCRHYVECCSELATTPLPMAGKQRLSFALTDALE